MAQDPTADAGDPPIELRRCTAGDLLAWLRSPTFDDTHPVVLLVEADTLDEADAPSRADGERLTSAPVIVAAVGHGLDHGDRLPTPWAQVVDLCVTPSQVDDLRRVAQAAPRSAVALAGLLRVQGRLLAAAPDDVGPGLVVESAVYSTLQAGPEFAAWRASRPVRSRAGADGSRGEPVLVDRVEDRLLVTLHRPEVRNALDASLRDAWLAALAVAEADPALAVELRGAGPVFSAGGDLDEFGSRADPATAHAVRLQRSIGRALFRLRDRTTAFLHGACYGSGIELPSFVGRVVADQATRFALPEVTLGLVPGAGGTASMTRRCGRHRVAWLALTAATIEADEALRWGLVDEIAPVAPTPAR